MVRLLPQDKANHVAYGALVAACALLALLLAMLALRVLGAAGRVPPSVCVALALAVAFIVAWWKEWVYDAAHSDTHTVDPRDFWSTVAGAIFVLLPAFVVAQVS